MFQALKMALTQPTNLQAARKMNRWQSFGYILLLNLIFLIPFVITIVSGVQNFKLEISEIEAEIPAFEINNNIMTLEKERDSFIYQGSGYLFFFDPQGEMSRDIVDENVIQREEDSGGSVFVAGGFLEDELYLKTSLDSIAVPYKNLAGLTKTQLFNLFSNRIFNYTLAILIVVLFLSSLVSLLLLQVVTTSLAVFINSAKGTPIRFGETWKMTLTTVTWPLLVFSILNSFGIYFTLQTVLIRIINLLIYSKGFQSTKPSS